MSERVIEIYGVKVTVRGRKVKYVMPWRRHEGHVGNKWAALAAVLSVVAAGFLPLLFFYFVKVKPWTLEAIFLWTFTLFWILACICFTAVFGLMAWSNWTRWGRAWVWVSRGTLVSAQLRGGDSLVSLTPLTLVKGFSTLPDGGDPKNPATPARLLTDLDNNVKRIFGDDPIQLVEAMRTELTGTVQKLRN